MKEILAQLAELQKKPEPFTPGEALFWDDPHISKHMLAAHLDPDTEAASRRPQVIDRSVEWLIATLPLRAGDSILDLGCGPGLYASRHARENNLQITYRYENYLDLKDEDLYDAALLIYGDFCPLNPGQRAKLLQNVYRALKPGGKFVFDVSTRELRQKHRNQNGWRVLESGFWKPDPHLLLEEGYDYPEQSIWLDQFITIEADGKISVYRNWFQDYTPDTITAELEQGGFRVDSLWGDLTGTAYTPESEWIGVVAQRS